LNNTQQNTTKQNQVFFAQIVVNGSQETVLRDHSLTSFSLTLAFKRDGGIVDSRVLQVATKCQQRP
ncbi:UNVERIFIED_CONTAM: hypothetical protein M9610_23540, partial [Salmonella sp. NW982]